MVRRRGPIEIGRPHGRLFPVVAASVFAVFTAVLIWLRAAPTAVTVAVALLAGIR